MPTVTETPVRAYCHCRNARCPGYQQQEVDAVRRETAQTYGDNGGDGVFVGMVERSSVHFLFADPDEAPCPGCGVPREVTGSARPSYQPLSGHDPLGLLGFGGFDAGMVIPPGEDRSAEIQANSAAVAAANERADALEARLAAMEKLLAEKEK